MPRDLQGLSLTGDSASAEAYDLALADYFGLKGDPVGKLRGAVERDPGFALGGIGLGFYFGSVKDAVYPVLVLLLLSILMSSGFWEEDGIKTNGRVKHIPPMKN